MPNNNSDPGNSGLTFFSRVSAAVSHEIKNVLAIINQNAGLLEDLVLMSEKGSPPSPERLHRLARTVNNQVKRADEIVKNMNRFAHSADHSLETVDVYDATVFIAGLGQRMIRSKEFEITVVESNNPVRIKTNLFYLQELIFNCIETIINNTDSGCSIWVEFRNTYSGAEIRFAWEGSTQSFSFLDSTVNGTHSLMNYLEAKPVDNPGVDSFGIQFPDLIGGSSKEQ